MVPILIVLEKDVPCLHRNRRTGANHVVPTPQIGRGQQFERRIGLTRIVERIEQELCRVNAAIHPARNEIIGDTGLVLRRHERKYDREHIAVNRDMVGTDSVAVKPAFFIEKILIDARCRTGGLRCIRRRVGLFPHSSRQFAHQLEAGIVEHVGTDIFRHEGKLAAGPVDDVVQFLVLRQADRIAQCGIDLRIIQHDNQSVLFLERRQRFVLQQRVIGLSRTDIARVEIIVPGDQHRLQNPFGRPGGMVKQVLVRTACKGKLTVDRVVAQLVEQSVGLIGNAFAVPVDINPGERGRLHRIAAQFPHPIQHGIGTGKMHCKVIERIMYRLPFDVGRSDIVLVSFDLEVAERQHLADVFRHRNGQRRRVARVARIGHDFDPVSMAPRQ